MSERPIQRRWSAASQRLAAQLARLRPGHWALLLGLALVAIYAGTVGASGPWDPWETHYGEVARNIVVRGDPMDLWWRPGYGPDGKREGVFASKHALPFWCMALSFKLFGIGDGPLDELVRSPLPELALRLPSMLAGLGTVALLGWCVARLVDWRAGLLVAAVLATMPQFAIIARQAVTDMFFVAPVCLAMVAWAMAWLGPERALKTRGLGWREIAWDRAWLGFFALFVLAALVPLAVLHLHVVDPETIERVARWKRKQTATVDDLHTIARHLVLYWLLAAVCLLRSLRWRRRSQVWMGVVYLAAGLSVMGKGLIGPGIIGMLIAVHMAVSGRLHLLWQRRCELALGVVLFALTCMPWHHAMALFRGERWVNELIVVNNLARFASGEQDQAIGGFAFYLRTLGLAALPWSAVIPPALWAAVLAFRRRSALASPLASVPPGRAPSFGPGLDASGRRLDAGGELHRLALLWFVVSLALITYSVTKYYHYLVPVLPPLAVVIGLWLARLLDAQARPAGEASEALPRPAVLACALGGCVIGYLVVRALIDEPAWLAHLTTYLYTGIWRKGAAPTERAAWCALPFALGLLLWLARRARAAVAAMLLSALLTTTWVLADYLPATSENWSQRTAFRHIYDRAEPGDKLLSWWFYYRGETYFAKRQIWVSMEPNRDELHAFVDEHRGQGVTFWVMTTARHAERAPAMFPGDLRPHLEVVYQNFHYALIRVDIP